MKSNVLRFEDNYEYIGQIFKTHENRYVKVVDVVNRYDVIVEFQDRSRQRQRTRMSIVKAGLVTRDCSHDSVIKFFNAAAQYNGTIWNTLEGCQLRILSYNSKNDVDIEFLDTGNLAKVRMSSIRDGSVKNNYKPNKYGAYFGDGPYTKRQHPKIYGTWFNIFHRLNPKNQENNTRNAAYRYVSICNEWYNYQIFAYWYDSYISSLNPEFYNDYQIDKDILQWDKKYKVYSPSTCCLIPSKLNSSLSNHDVERISEPDLPIGVHKNTCGNTYMINLSIDRKSVYPGMFKDPMEAFYKYKELKEEYIRSLASEYYSKNAITKEVYDAVLNISIEPFQTYTDM